MDKRLASNSTNHHLVGESFTIGDFYLGALIFNIFYNEGNELFEALKPLIDSYENLKSFAENFSIQMTEYLASRPQPRPL